MSNSIALSIAPGELRLLVARKNGFVQPIHQLTAELPNRAVTAGLEAPNLADADVVREALRGLTEAVAADCRRAGELALLIPDASVRMALVPLEGAEPTAAEGEAMARWALRDVLPASGEQARIDWSLLHEQSAPATGWLLAVGADASVVTEYESIALQLGWTPGRVVPLTLGLSVGVGETSRDDDPKAARLVICGVGGSTACLVEADGVPRMHRVWRGVPNDLAHELRTIAAYVSRRFELSIVEAVLAGPEVWRDDAATVCESLGWRAHERSLWSALVGVVRA